MGPRGALVARGREDPARQGALRPWWWQRQPVQPQRGGQGLGSRRGGLPRGRGQAEGLAARRGRLGTVPARRDSHDRSWAAAELQAAAAALHGTRWAKVRRLLLDPRTLTFLDRLQQDLAAAEPCPERREALAALWRGREAGRRGRGEAGGWAVLPVRLGGWLCARV